MKYKLLLFFGIAPLLITTALSIWEGKDLLDIPNRADILPVEPLDKLEKLKDEEKFFQGLGKQLNQPLVGMNPALQASAECKEIHAELGNLNDITSNWKKILADLQSEAAIKDLCGMKLDAAKATLNAIPVAMLPVLQKTLAQEMITDRVAIIDGIEEKVGLAKEVNTAWKKGNQLYEEGIILNDNTLDDGPDDAELPVANAAGQAWKKFEEAGEEFTKVELEIFQQQRCEVQDEDLTGKSLANVIEKAAFMKDATHLLETYERVYPKDPSKYRGEWIILKDNSDEAMEKYVQPDPETEIPGIEPIAGIDPAVYKRMDKNHRNMLAKDKLSRIELPETIGGEGGLTVWLEEVKEAFVDLDDPKLKEAIRTTLRSFLVEKIREKTYQQPAGLMTFTMMVDMKKTVKISPGVVVISDKWQELKGTAPNQYFEFKTLSATPLALLYEDKQFSATAMQTGFLFESAFEHPNAQPESLSPLVAHQVLTDLISEITRPDAPIHMPGTWDQFKTNLDKQLDVVKLYQERGGRDFGAVESFKTLVSASQEILDLFKTTNINVILKPPLQP